MTEGKPSRGGLAALLSSPLMLALGALLSRLVDGYSTNPAALLNLALGAALATVTLGCGYLGYQEWQKRGRERDLYLQNWIAAETRTTVAIQVAQEKKETPP